MKTRNSFLVAALLLLICGAAAAVSTVLPFGTIPLGTKNLDGGSDKVDTLTPGGVTGSGPDASGTICNKLPGGVPMTDVTIDLTNATAGGVTVNGTTSGAASGGSSFNVKFDSSVNFDECVTLEIDDISPNESGKLIDIYATPSKEESINGSIVEVNVFPLFELEESRDLQRTTIAFMDHGAGVAHLRNNDAARGLTEINGEVSFPGGGARTLSDVELQDASGSTIASTVSILGNTFTISGFSTVPAGAVRKVVVLFDNSTGRPATRLELEGVFTP
jgi:hypothetical protein